MPTRKAVKHLKSNFWLLYKAQLASMFWAGKKNAKKKKSAKVGSAAGKVIPWLVLGVIMAVYEWGFMGILVAEDAAHLFAPMVATCAMLMTILTTISYAKVLLFEAKDHDLLFSLPLDPRTIVAAKLAVMVTLDSVLNLVMLIPCGIFYGIYASPALPFYFYYFLLIPFVSFIPILFASIISALVSLLASRFRHAQVVSIVLYVIFLFAVMSVSFVGGSSAGSEGEMAMLSPLLEGFLEGLASWYLPLRWFMEATADLKLSSALLFAGVSLLAFAVVAVVFGKFYGKLHEVFRPRAVRRKYKTEAKNASALISLMKKDFKHITSSANLFMNQFVGVLMIVVFAVMFSIQDFGVAGEELNDFKEIFSIIIPFVFAMAAAMVCDTSTSISLEGKTFPLLKSLPIPVKTILYSKLGLHLAFCAPVILLCGIAVSIINGLPLMGMIATVVIPLCYAYTGGIVGLLINLKKYKFDWTSEIVIAKNSLPIVLTMIGGMLLSIIPMILAILLLAVTGSLAMVLGIFTALSLAGAVIMTLVMRAVGEKWFLAIEY